jgi:hypothetical protein
LSVEVLEDRTVPSFLPPVTSLGPAGTLAAVGDFNNDGRADLLSTTPVSPWTVNLQLGNGDGTFGPARSVGTGPYQPAFATGDFNGDGNLDVAVSRSGVDVMLGRGDGSFQAPTHDSVPNFGPTYSVAAGDLNGDGKLDLAVGSEVDGPTQYGPTGDGYSFGYTVTAPYTAYASVLLGNGDGSFSAAGTYIVATGQRSLILPRGYAPPPFVLVTLGDFNGDHRPDILVGGSLLSSQNKLLLGRGDGTMSTPQRASVFSTLVGDFDGDARADLLTVSGLMLGNGDGTFRTALTFPAGTGGVALGDFNGDGKLDVVTANSAGSTVSLMLGNGNGTFGPAQQFAAGPSPGRLMVADFNGDGLPDVAVFGHDSSSRPTTTVLLNDGHW